VCDDDNDNVFVKVPLLILRGYSKGRCMGVMLLMPIIYVCMYSGSTWGWSILDDSNELLPYICEIPKAYIYKIIAVSRGYGECFCIIWYSKSN